MAENQFFIDSDKLSEAALERKHKLETDPSSRTNHMEYMPGMEQIDPTIRNKSPFRDGQLRLQQIYGKRCAECIRA